MERKDKQLVPYRATHPGEIVREELKERKISTKDFAKQIGIPQTHLNDFLHGRKNMTEELAHKLECALGIDAAFWMRFHQRYLQNSRIIAERKQKDRPLNMIILKAMNEQGYSSEQVAQLVGVDSKRIDAYTTGKAIPSLKVAGILCTVLSIAPSTMLGL
ncbi:MAG: HigA family addiction module antidote protein [Bacteroidales bacterium]|nr:HigA family addiction module antidote protein [Bacteroidales bacterium]